MVMQKVRVHLPAIQKQNVIVKEILNEKHRNKEKDQAVIG